MLWRVTGVPRFLKADCYSAVWTGHAVLIRRPPMAGCLGWVGPSAAATGDAMSSGGRVSV